MTTYKTPFANRMAHGEKMAVERGTWEDVTGVPAANGATYPLEGGAFLRLFNVNEPALLVVEQVGVECVVPLMVLDETRLEPEPDEFTPDPDDEPDIA